MRASIDHIVGSHGVVDDGHDNAVLEISIAHVNDHPSEALETLRAWRDTEPEARARWPSILGALLYITADVEPLSREVIDGVVSLDVSDTRHLALRRLPAGLASLLDAEVVVHRVEMGIADSSTVSEPRERIELLLSLAEHALGAFEKAVRPDSKVGYERHWLRPLADSMRKPLAQIVERILSDLAVSNVERVALFQRLWVWLRQGWLDQLRYADFDSERLASILDSRDAVERAVTLLRAETKTVQTSASFRPLLFALSSRLEDPDTLREALPASPTWRHHEAIVRAYEKAGRSSDAIAYLESLGEGPDRDEWLMRLMRDATSPEEAFAVERPSPSNLDALGRRYGKSKMELIAVGIERMRRGEEDEWLEYLVREGAWEQALVVARGADPERVLRLLDTPFPPARAHELARTCLEHAFDTRKVWRDGARAKKVVVLLLDKTIELAPDAKARAKSMKQARTRAGRVIQKGTDFFVRELAFALDEALDHHEAHTPPRESS